jgi:hypothetical protein
VDDERLREVGGRVAERYLAEPMQRDAFRNDPQYHHNVDLLRKMVTATEQAMAAEGIGPEVRDRVIHRLLFGEAPESYAEPDFREAHRRMADRDQAVAKRMTEVGRIRLPDGWRP